MADNFSLHILSSSVIDFEKKINMNIRHMKPPKVVFLMFYNINGNMTDAQLVRWD